MKLAERTREIHSLAEQSYDRLDGEWHDWLEVAHKYEHKVLYEDRLDIRHDIILELHHARERDCKPLPILRAYRIASLTVALYWREILKPLIKVCVIDGKATKPDYAKCSFTHKPPKCSDCPFLAQRPIQSLDSEVDDGEGNTVALKDTIADDKAIDLGDWLDLKTWLLGCPMRLIEIAQKKLAGEPLTAKDRMYLSRYRHKEQKRLF